MTKTSKKSLLFILSIVMVVALAISMIFGTFTAYAEADEAAYAAFDAIYAAINPAGLFATSEEMKAVELTPELIDALKIVCALEPTEFNRTLEKNAVVGTIQSFFKAPMASAETLKELIASCDGDADGILTATEIEGKTATSFRTAVKSLCSLSEDEVTVFKKLLTANELTSYNAVTTVYGKSVEIININNKYTANEIEAIMPSGAIADFEASKALADYAGLSEGCKKFVDFETNKCEKLNAAKAKFTELAEARDAFIAAVQAIQLDESGAMSNLDPAKYASKDQKVILSSRPSIDAVEDAYTAYATLLDGQFHMLSITPAQLVYSYSSFGASGEYNAYAIYQVIKTDLETALAPVNALLEKVQGFATATSDGTDSWGKSAEFKAFEQEWMAYFFPAGMFGPSNADAMFYFNTYCQETLDSYSTILESVYALDVAIANAQAALQAMKVLEGSNMVDVDPEKLHADPAEQVVVLASEPSVLAAEEALNTFNSSFEGQTLADGETLVGILKIEGVDYCAILTEMKTAIANAKAGISQIMSEINTLYLGTNYGVDVWSKQAEITELRERIEGTYVSDENDKYPSLPILTDTDLIALAKSTVPGSDPVEYVYPYYAFLIAMENRVTEIEGLRNAAKVAIAAIQVWGGSALEDIDTAKLSAEPATQEVVLTSKTSMDAAKAAIDAFVSAGGATSEIENYATYEAAVSGYNAQIAKVDSLMNDIKTVFETTNDLTVVFAHANEIKDLTKALNGEYEGETYTNMQKDAHNDLSTYAKTTALYSEYRNLLTLMNNRLTAIEAKFTAFETAVGKVMVYDSDGQSMKKYSDYTIGEIVLASKDSLDNATDALNALIAELASEMTREQVITYLDDTSANAKYDVYTGMLEDYDDLLETVQDIVDDIEELYEDYQTNGATALYYDLDAQTLTVIEEPFKLIDDAIALLDDESVIDQYGAPVNNLKGLLINEDAFIHLNEMKFEHNKLGTKIVNATNALPNSKIQVWLPDTEVMAFASFVLANLGESEIVVLDTVASMTLADNVVEHLYDDYWFGGMTLPTCIDGDITQLLGEVGAYYRAIKSAIKDLYEQIEDNFAAISAFSSYYMTTGGYVYGISEQVMKFYDCVFGSTETATITVGEQSYTLKRLEGATDKDGHNNLVSYAQSQAPYASQYAELANIKSAVDAILADIKSAEDAIAAIEVWNSTAMEAYGEYPLAVGKFVCLESGTSLVAAKTAIDKVLKYLSEEEWGADEAARLAEIDKSSDYTALRAAYEAYELKLLKIMYAVYSLYNGTAVTAPTSDADVDAFTLPTDYAGKTNAEVKTAIETLLGAIDLSSYNGDLTLTSNSDPNVYAIDIDMVDAWKTYMTSGSIPTFGGNATYMAAAISAMGDIYDAAHAAVTLVQTAINDVIANEANITAANVDTVRTYILAIEDAYQDLDSTQQALITNYPAFKEIYDRIQLASYLEAAIDALIYNYTTEAYGVPVTYTDEVSVDVNALYVMYYSLPANTKIFVRNIGELDAFAAAYAEANEEDVFPLGLIFPMFESIVEAIGDFDFETYADIATAIDELTALIADFDDASDTIQGILDTIGEFEGFDTIGDAIAALIELQGDYDLTAQDVATIQETIGTFNFTQYADIAAAIQDLIDLNGKFNELKGDFDDLAAMVGTFSSADYDTIAAALSDVISKLNTAIADITSLKADMTTAQGDIDTLEAEDVTIHGLIDALQTYVDGVKAALEAKDVELQGNIDALEATMNAKVAELQAQIDTLFGNVAEINATIGDFDFEDYDTITEAITAIINMIADAEAEIGALQENVIDLQSATESLAAQDVVLGSLIDNLAAALESAKTALEIKDAELDSKIDALEAAMNEEIANIHADITNLSNELAAKVAELQATDAADKAEVLAKLANEIASLKAELESKMEIMDNAYKAADVILASRIAEMSDELANKVAELKSAQAADKAILENLVAATKAELEAADAANKAELQEKIDAIIADYDQQVSDLYTAIIIVAVVVACGFALMLIFKKKN